MPSLTANKTDQDTFDMLLANAIDITGAADVQVLFNKCTRTVHVNVNGVCVLRVYRAETMELEQTSFPR